MGIPLNVLIVEDSEDDAILVVRELERAGYDVKFERVETAKDFLSHLTKQTWDVVLADYTLPNFNGLEALKILKKSGLGLPFIIVSGTILYVDDEEVILNVGRRILEALGYQVFSAPGGHEAIEIFKDNQDKIDLVVLDMIMPGISCGEIYSILKEYNPKLRILLASGYNIDGQAGDMLERGCDGFIQKPFDIKELSQKLREILDKKI